MTSVIVLGAGVGGLTAAHELAERGFTVTVYEKLDIVGGKARSMRWPSQLGDVPGEHGFRFFPGFYRHITNTMKRIPFAGAAQGAFSNLEEADQGAFAQEGKPVYAFPAHQPRTIVEVAGDLQSFFSVNDLGLAGGDIEYFLDRMLKVMSMSEERRMAELEPTPWWVFSGAAARLPQYQKILARGMTRSLVAMRAEVANSRTVGTILVRMIRDLSRPGDSMDRLLTGPTNEVFVDAWRAHLLTLGVTFEMGATAEEFLLGAGQVSGVRVTTGGVTTVATAEYYVSAVPVEVMEQLVGASAGLAAAAPSLANLNQLQREWMNGIQFYLKRRLDVVHGHVIYIDSPWALTSISQRQFWTSFALPQINGQTVEDILSVDISDWETAGPLTGKKARDCTPDEIARECWGQLKAHLSSDPAISPLVDADLVTSFLDPSITFSGAPGSGGISPERVPPIVPGGGAWGVSQNDEPLLINTAGSWAYRPRSRTDVPNLFLASDYVRTATQLACMEGANEAGRRAANGVLAASGSTAPIVALFDFPEPRVFLPFRRLDAWRFKHGKTQIVPRVPWGLVKFIAKALHFVRKIWP